MSPYIRWLWVLWCGFAGIVLSLGCGFTPFLDWVLSTETLTPLLLNKQAVFGVTLVISFIAVGIAQHFLAKIMGDRATYHIKTD